MKPSHSIAPVFALIAVIGWSGSEYYSISQLEKNSAQLTALLTAQSSDASLITRPPPENPTAAKKPLNLAQFEQVAKSDSKLAMIELDLRYQNMTAAELISALDEIDATEAQGKSAGEHKITLLTQLCHKDPETALARYFERIKEGDGITAQILAVGLRNWCLKQPIQAMAWFDKMAAASNLKRNSLTDQSNSQSLFEGALINALVSSDLTAATTRLNALPEPRRIKALQSGTAGLTQPESQVKFANFIRSQLSEEDQTRTLAAMAANLITGDPWSKTTTREFVEGLTNDYTPIDDFLNRINATPAERIACVRKSALRQIEWRSYDFDKISLQEIDTIRAWTLEQAPSIADEITGAALANKIKWGTGGFPFEEAAKFAAKYSEANGSDKILITFLTYNGYQIDRKAARKFAETIPDPERRKNLLKHLN